MQEWTCFAVWLQLLILRLARQGDLDALAVVLAEASAVLAAALGPLSGLMQALERKGWSRTGAVLRWLVAYPDPLAGARQRARDMRARYPDPPPVPL
jgi:hypothetical protein